MKSINLGNVRNLDRDPELKDRLNEFMQRKFAELGDEAAVEYFNSNPEFREVLKSVRRGAGEALKNLEAINRSALPENAQRIITEVENALGRAFEIRHWNHPNYHEVEEGVSFNFSGEIVHIYVNGRIIRVFKDGDPDNQDEVPANSVWGDYDYSMGVCRRKLIGAEEAIAYLLRK